MWIVNVVIVCFIQWKPSRLQWNLDKYIFNKIDSSDLMLAILVHTDKPKTNESLAKFI